MMVNSKIALSFAAGAVLATGVVYVTLRPPVRPRPARAVTSTPAAVTKAEPASAPQPEPAAAPPAISEAAPAPAARPAPAVRPRKPSPMPPAHPAEIAAATPPADNVPASVRSDPPPAAAPAPAPPAAEPAPPEPTRETAPEVPVSEPAPPPVNRVTLRQGMVIAVRLSEALSSDNNEKGDTFFATLDAPLAADGFVIAERGARAEGIVDVVRGGRGNGAAHLVLQLTSVHTSDGQRVPIETATFDRKAETSGGEDAAKVGGGAALGAIIGALAGGGKGAGIGALAGGAAGAGGAVLTHGRTAKLPVESRISFRLQRDVTVTERAR